MQFARPLIAPHPASFGRGRVRDSFIAAATGRRLSDDFRLFATTFVAGFLVVSVLIS
jgi:hypothetical protein